MNPDSFPSRRESWAALAYSCAYLAYLFATLESELAHWLTLVVLPVLIALTFGGWRRSPAEVLTTFGLRRENWRRGVGWALLLGALITVGQLTLFGHRREILALIESGQALWLYPLMLLLMFGMAGFTEEFFFRGFLSGHLAFYIAAGHLENNTICPVTKMLYSDNFFFLSKGEDYHWLILSFEQKVSLDVSTSW